MGTLKVGCPGNNLLEELPLSFDVVEAPLIAVPAKEKPPLAGGFGSDAGGAVDEVDGLLPVAADDDVVEVEAGFVEGACAATPSLPFAGVLGAKLDGLDAVDPDAAKSPLLLAASLRNFLYFSCAPDRTLSRSAKGSCCSPCVIAVVSCDCSERLSPRRAVKYSTSADEPLEGGAGSDWLVGVDAEVLAGAPNVNGLAAALSVLLLPLLLLPNDPFMPAPCDGIPFAAEGGAGLPKENSGCLEADELAADEPAVLPNPPKLPNVEGLAPAPAPAPGEGALATNEDDGVLPASFFLGNPLIGRLPAPPGAPCPLPWLPPPSRSAPSPLPRLCGSSPSSRWICRSAPRFILSVSVPVSVSVSGRARYDARTRRSRAVAGRRGQQRAPSFWLW